jgi:hypothetical protein
MTGSNESCYVRIVIADNSAIVRSGLVAVLRHLPGLSTVTFDVKTQDSLRNYIHMQHPDIVIVNPLFDGVFDVKGFACGKTCQPKFIAIVNTMLDKNLLSNYDSHLSIYDTTEEIATKIREVLNTPTPSEGASPENLSQREREIVVCVVKGMTNKEIADQLCLSVHTVITHRRNIAQKLEIHSSVGLTIYAIVNKLVELNEINV